MHRNNWTEVRRRRRTGDTNASHRRILVATTFYAFGIPNNKGKRRFGNFLKDSKLVVDVCLARKKDSGKVSKKISPGVLCFLKETTRLEKEPPKRISLLASSSSGTLRLSGDFFLKETSRWEIEKRNTKRHTPSLRRIKWRYNNYDASLSNR